MVREDKFEQQTAYMCEACGFHYREKELAKECEEHCREQDACSGEITEKALERR